jgi:penicillin amidase
LGGDLNRVAAAPPPGRIEILRDTWGIPHIFADTDAGALYGLGYATADDRAFQMTYSLRIIQGRLAETVGDVAHVRRRESAVDNDRKMRTFGFYRAAQRTVEGLDAESRDLLEAYSTGVNAWFQKHKDDLPSIFSRLELKPEPWTPADCLASWWHLGQFFATDGTRDLIAARNSRRGAVGRGRDRATAGRATARGGRTVPTPPANLKPLPPDNAPAVVKRSDVSPEWIERVDAFAHTQGWKQAESGTEGPKFSHAWVVGGKRSTTGAAVLVSDPQTPVRSPSLFHEFHISGKTFNARGLGVPGSPIVLIGFTEQVAWGVTALGADQADLFRLETDDGHPDQYRFDGTWRPMTLHPEQIKVKDGTTIDYLVRETHLGPVATAFCYAQPNEGEVALKRIPICENDRETIQGALAMLRASNVQEFAAALQGWRFPSMNALFGDRHGDIGYMAVVASPIRSKTAVRHGRQAMPGTRSEHDWQGFVPYDLLPQVINPSAGFLYSGNHRPIESWYPIPFGAMTGTGGDTVRSWRLRERLEICDEFTPEEVRDIHYDATNPARRDIVGLAIHLAEAQPDLLSANARRALEVLRPWHERGALSDLTSPGAALAMELNTFFRFMATDLAYVYGGGESGLSYFLKTVTQRIEQDPAATITEQEAAYIDQSLTTAWRQANQKHGSDPTAWNRRARENLQRQRLGFGESLDGFPSVDRNLDLSMPSLDVIDGGTIRSQLAQAYTQWVPMHDPDQAQSILPIGQSDRPDSPWQRSTLTLWSEGKLHPAPISRKAVEKIVASRLILRD